MKLDTIDFPPVQDGVISASKTPVFDEGRSVNVHIRVSRQITDDSTSKFFQRSFTANENNIPEYQIANSLQKVLKDKKASEEELRDAVFTDFLKQQKIGFADSSCSDDIDKNGHKKYTEGQINSLLIDFGKEIGVTKEENMKKYMRELPVTTTSRRPDLVPRDHRAPGFQQLWMGEFKNRDNYEEENGRTQCVLYLLALLYWLRTVAGKPVESVYGFYVCGCRCFDQQRGRTYTVGLLKLTAPEYLGDELTAYCLSIKRFVEDPLPLRVLIHFLKNGKQWTVSSTPPLFDKPIPCFFLLPISLWSDDDGKRMLVPHDTLSIVFRITAQGLKDLLQDESLKHFQKMSNKVTWQKYRDGLCKLVDKQDPAAWYYLKIRTKNSAWQSRPMGAMDDTWDVLIKDKDPFGILDTYIDRPFVDETFGMVLMNDRGSILRDVNSFDKKVLSEFSRVRSKAMFLSNHLPHGDVLPHNLVFDETSGKMTLIDIDEGVVKESEGEDHILQRKNTYNVGDQDWFIALSYPNPLRNKASEYTQTQLLASFLFLSRKIENLPQKFLDGFQSLEEVAKKLGHELCDLDKKGDLVSETAGPTVVKSVLEADKAVDELIGGAIKEL